MSVGEQVPRNSELCGTGAARGKPRGFSIAVFTRFYPNIGGVETVAELLAHEWASAGHRVTIVTDVAAAQGPVRDFPFPVLHRPGPREILGVVRDCDLVVHHNISLKALWPVLLVHRPFVAVNHDRYHPGEREGRNRPWKERIKLWIARHVANSICVSNATKDGVGCDGPVIHNLYDETAFQNLGRRRDKDLVFVGRLVSDKGANVLLDALDELKRQGVMPGLIIIGDGPERANIERQIRDYRLAHQVTVAGRLSRGGVVGILNEHKIMVVPSIYPEGFGVVALEGAACGCVVVGSQIGGLPEAIGPCGVTFPSGDHRALAAVLADLLRNPAKLDGYRAATPAHLDTHRPELVAAKYLEFFQQVLSSRNGRKR